jgi:class 3 adenylate cyclase/tetratricopeptide (TPR) repeat protein
MNCPNCNSPTPPNAKFCPNCGQPLAAEALPVVQTTGVFDPDRYLPPELASKLEASRAKDSSMQGERRIITMLFCDVKGSTAAAEQLDPEEWTEIINGAFEHMIRPIYKYEGIVPRLMGDAILAFFGAPIAHEDDPQRAVLAGLEIQESIGPYAKEIRERFGVSFALRVGINTGLVVVGAVGSDLRMEYTAIGDAINLAARMEQTAAPGSVQISGETYKLVAPFFEFEALGGIQVKGKAEPVKSYRVLSVKETPGQLRGLEGFTSPLVGREAELAALEEGLAALHAGTGAVISVLGEAGLGKSSLVAAAHHKLDSTSVSWFEAHALSYAQSISYFSWRQIIRASIDAHESDTPADVRDKLHYVCEYCTVPGGDIPFLEAILAVESQRSLGEVSGFQGDALLRRITEATRGYLCAAARELPLAVVFDDLHWIDEASLTLLSSLIDLVDENPVLFLCVMRPDRETPAWDFNQRVKRELPTCSRQIELSPFSNETTNAMLVNLLGPRDLPKSLYDQIIEKAEGNPFFAEEIIRSLIETEQIVRDNGDWHAAQTLAKISLPKTLSGVLSARIDRLPEGPKQTLRFASVVGRLFEVQTLSAMSSSTNGLEAHLQKLEDAGLIQGVPGNDGIEFTFRHVLIQEATYNSILLKQRRALHARVGEYLESNYSDRLNEFAPLLAHHFYSARDKRSLKYDEIAGENAARLYANAEAATHFRRALEVAQRIDASVERVETLFKNLGQALELSGHYEEALDNYSQMEAYAQTQVLPSMQVAALTARATIYSIFTPSHSSELSEQMLVKALAISKEIGDPEVETRLHWNLMLNYLFSKRPNQALEHGQLALGLARASEDREQLAFVLNDLCRLYTCRGEFDKAYTVIREARELWKDLDHQVMLADSYGSEAEACFNAGEFKRAFDLAESALQISEKTENLWGQSYDRMLMSFVLLENGGLGRGIKLAEQSVQLADGAGLLASSIGMRSELAWVYAYCGAYEKGLALVDQAIEVAETQQPAWLAFPQAAKVRIYLLQGNLRSADQFAGKTLYEPISIPYARYTIFLCLANIELAYSREDYELALSLADDLLNEVLPLTRVDLPEVLHWKGKALFSAGNLKDAHQTLIQARSRAERLDANPQLWPILESLARVEEQLGNEVEAERHREAARSIVWQIADSLRETGFRDSFLEQTRV